ncbi:uncharacterized protein MELLADRAFT_105505 [Melampsora larici-populina 98AG31]|uniref:Uncharacterized protein n=1 Tax=Melampsora larici-populina (strain 98AG31 / pathotype 3-4-7) TaxID=747676 RepID=F4RIF6_MELLP|nr:uncharacterized protein MELLADRAFT_105505 [Melampsora larici-populina 98AG31]EGG07842.1 hypothetical protein MELLADRAFT_105505 [Melampsora larici-populina 98AG31]
MYSNKFKESLLPAENSELKMKHTSLPDIKHMASIFPASKAKYFHFHPDPAHNSYYPSNKEVLSDELEDSNVKSVTNTPISNDILKDVESCFQTQIRTLQANLAKSITNLTKFKNELHQLMPMRLNNLKKAMDDINVINQKLDELHGQLGGVDGETPRSEILIEGSQGFLAKLYHLKQSCPSQWVALEPLEVGLIFVIVIRFVASAAPGCL